eukprot:3485682-Alexandrium_andersonii.AAC.1
MLPGSPGGLPAGGAVSCPLAGPAMGHGVALPLRLWLSVARPLVLPAVALSRTALPLGGSTSSRSSLSCACSLVSSLANVAVLHSPLGAVITSVVAGAQLHSVL